MRRNFPRIYNLTKKTINCLVEARESRERAQTWANISFIERWLKDDSSTDGISYQ